ncbi:hypothetical protein GOBAR_DD21839 [Gossypium barbadense]|nr:hypothetical protein GOBAR_DD21839 [Gossypium barbadense]
MFGCEGFYIKGRVNRRVQTIFRDQNFSFHVSCRYSRSQLKTLAVEQGIKIDFNVLSFRCFPVLLLTIKGSYFCQTKLTTNQASFGLRAFSKYLLFAELVGVEATEDPTLLGEEDRVQVPCMVVPVSYVDSRSTIHGIDIDLNAAAETDVVGDDVYYSSDPVDYEVDSESHPDVDEVPDDIDDEGINKVETLTQLQLETRFVIL